MDTYTMEQLERGEGFFANDWTCIWRMPDGRYITAGRSETPAQAGMELVGGGRLKADGTPAITWA